MKKIIVAIIISMFLGSVLTIVIADTINSNEVLYDNTLSTSSATDVKGAIDDLYDKVVHDNTGYKMIGHIDDSVSNELLGGLYRYQGTNVNNYICFGTTNKSDCVSDNDRYMYRIIGFNLSGQLKLIKSNALPSSYSWYSNNTFVDWPYSIPYTAINGADFLENVNYIPDSTWSNRIELENWHYYESGDSTISTIFEREISAPTIEAKVGLLYLHDYAYSLSDPSYSKRSWMFLNGSLFMTRYEANGYHYGPWYINSYGELSAHAYATYGGSLRPVFFLKATEAIASGSGTLADPYILN